MLITFLIIFPLIGALIVYLSESIFSTSLRMKLALMTAGLNFIISLCMWIQFDENTVQFQFVEDWGSLFSGGLCHLIIGVDGISLFFIILTTFLTIPIILTPPYKGESPIAYLIAILILSSMLIAVFVVLDLLLFYICFETVLIPMFLIIGMWGSRERKVLAAYQFFLYTLLGSLFMLLGILIIYYQTGTTDYQYLLGSIISEKIIFTRENLLWLTFFFSFAVKVPMMPFTLWLYSAHSEAPTGGSMILAGVLLKLAGYGFLRYSLPLFPNASIYFSPFILTLAIISIIYSIFACLRQTDLKTIIAYSSVSHMNIGIIGIFSNTIPGIEGSIFMMISHGIVSSALFFCIGLLYDRTGTRILKYYRGLAVTMPIFSLLFFILILSNMAVPFTSGFVGELLAFIGIFKTNPIVCLLASISIILGATYNIWLASRLLFGSLSKYFSAYNDLTRREFMILLPCVFLTILLGIFPNIILDSLHSSCSALINNLATRPLNSWYLISRVGGSGDVISSFLWLPGDPL